LVLLGLTEGSWEDAENIKKAIGEVRGEGVPLEKLEEVAIAQRNRKDGIGYPTDNMVRFVFPVTAPSTG